LRDHQDVGPLLGDGRERASRDARLPDLPLEVSAIDSIPEATDAPERSLRIIARQSVSLLHIRDGDAVSCEVLDRCLDVSRYLLEQATDWLG
jgi:hypothetical protein